MNPWKRIKLFYKLALKCAKIAILISPSSNYTFNSFIFSYAKNDSEMNKELQTTYYKNESILKKVSSL